MHEGKFPLGKLVTNQYSLEQIEEARVALEQALPNCSVFGLGESEPDSTVSAMEVCRSDYEKGPLTWENGAC